MDIEEAERRFNTFRDRLHDYPASIIEHATAPLATIEDRVTDIRSSVLIQIGEFKFIVTAAHDVGAQIDEGLPLFVLMRNKCDRPVALHHEQFYATKESSIDLAVARLHPSTVEHLKDAYRYVSLPQMMSRHDPGHKGAFYTLAGFPSANYGKDHEGVDRADNWKYLTFGFLGEPVDYNPEIHLNLAYDTDSKDEEGKIIDPHGLSGCGVWYVGNPFSNTVVTPDEFRLVAIQTKWNEKRQYVKTTWINSVLRIIWRYHPEARPALEQHGVSY